MSGYILSISIQARAPKFLPPSLHGGWYVFGGLRQRRCAANHLDLRGWATGSDQRKVMNLKFSGSPRPRYFSLDAAFFPWNCASKLAEACAQTWSGNKRTLPFFIVLHQSPSSVVHAADTVTRVPSAFPIDGTIVIAEEVNVIGRHDVVQNTKTEALLGLEEPIAIALTIADKLDRGSGVGPTQRPDWLLSGSLRPALFFLRRRISRRTVPREAPQLAHKRDYLP